MSDFSEHIKTVNQSGFPLQIGIAHLVRETTRNHGWTVHAAEHSWKNVQDDASGFMDLILENRYRTVALLVECKKVLNAAWIFLNPSEQLDLRSHAKGWVSFVGEGGAKYFDWRDLNLDPVSTESAYCVIQGEDKSKPLLEKIAAEVISATEALAQEEKVLLNESLLYFRAYFSVIITTAKLMACSFTPDQVSIVDGKISNQHQFQELEFLRFRKQLSTRVPEHLSNLRDLARAKEHTVFVVQASSLVKFLSNFELQEESLRFLKLR